MKLPEGTKEIELTVAAARNACDNLGDEAEALCDALEEAQGAAHTKNKDQFILIKVKGQDGL